MTCSLERCASIQALGCRTWSPARLAAQTHVSESFVRVETEAPTAIRCCRLPCVYDPSRLVRVTVVYWRALIVCIVECSLVCRVASSPLTCEHACESAAVSSAVGGVGAAQLAACAARRFRHCQHMCQHQARPVVVFFFTLHFSLLACYTFVATVHTPYKDSVKSRGGQSPITPPPARRWRANSSREGLMESRGTAVPGRCQRARGHRI